MPRFDVVFYFKCPLCANITANHQYVDTDTPELAALDVLRTVICEYCSPLTPVETFAQIHVFSEAEK